MDVAVAVAISRHALTVPVMEGVRLPVRLAPKDRVVVEVLVGVRVGLLVLLEEGVSAPEFVVVMVALIVPELVKEDVWVEEVVIVCEFVPVWDAESDEEPDPVFVEEGVQVPVKVPAPVPVGVLVPVPVRVLVPVPVFVALVVKVPVPVCVGVRVAAAVKDGVPDPVLAALREGLVVDVDE